MIDRLVEVPSGDLKSVKTIVFFKIETVTFYIGCDGRLQDPFLFRKVRVAQDNGETIHCVRQLTAGEVSHQRRVYTSRKLASDIDITDELRLNALTQMLLELIKRLLP